MEREKLGSRLGFILLSAGCAIGVGNVWKFPYLCGQNGGGMFVLIYLFFLLIMGVPVMCIEFSLGRASQTSPVNMYRTLEPKGTKWHWHTPFIVIGNYLLMMFYTSVAGWLLKYFISTAKGDFVGMTTEQVGDAFGAMTADPWTMVIFMAIVVVVGFLICSFSLQGGLERITKYMMLALLAIMVVLAINSFTMNGAKEGLSFYLVPDFAKMKEVGIGTVIVNAMNQAFFTLSLGMGNMMIFGSYLKKDRSLLGESATVTLLDTFVAIVAGLIIFPACFSYGVEAGAGPSLIFVTLPNIFNNMPLGRLWGSLFFIFMCFAAFSTVLAVFENINAMCMDKFGWSRKKASVINCIALLALSLPCALGFNLLSGFEPFGAGTNFMDLEDFLVSNCILPLGSLIFVLFITSKKGWGWKNFMEESNQGKGLKVKKWLYGYCKYILPVLIIVLFIIGIYNFFA